MDRPRSATRARLVGRLRDRATPLVGLALLLGAWSLGARLQSVHILPGPLEVARGLVELARRGVLVRHVVASLFRVTWGYGAALVTALPIGLALGWFRRGERALNPLVQLLRPISPLAWIPLSILWFGVGDGAAVFIIYLGAFLPLVVTTVNAVHGVPSVHLHAGRNFGLGPIELVERVVFPSILPQLLVGMRLALGVAWLVVVAAEMIAVNSGLGFLIVDSRNAGNRYDLVVAGMLLIGTIGLLLDAAVRQIDRLPLLAWATSGGLDDAPADDAAATASATGTA